MHAKRFLFTLGLLAAQAAGLGGCAEDTPGEIIAGLPCDDTEESIYADPGEVAARARGEVLRCRLVETIDVAAMGLRLAALVHDTSIDPSVLRPQPNGCPPPPAASPMDPTGVISTYSGDAASSGARIYKVLYRTERGNGQPGYAVAQVFLPTKPRSAKLPLILAARGSRGQAASCAPSRLAYSNDVGENIDNRTGSYVQIDYNDLIYPLLSQGFAVAASDSAGFSNYGAPGNPPSAFASPSDMGRSLLDSGLAMQSLAPSAFADQTVLFGFSQGGHTTLGALAQSATYPPPAPIIAAVTPAPLWFSQRAWGLVIDPEVAVAVGLKLNESATVPTSIWFHYSQAELFDGPGEGIKLFRPAMQAAVKRFVDTTCWSRYYRELAETCGVFASDFFTEAMVNSVGARMSPFRGNGKCAGDALCEKWLGRYRDAYPDITGEAEKVPILIAYGGLDTTITPDRLACGVQKLDRGANPLSFCYDPASTHGGVVLKQAQFLTEWISNKALGTRMRTSCPSETLPSVPCDPLLQNE